VLQIKKSKVLNHLQHEDDTKLSTFKITLWKLDANEPAFVLAEQRIEVSAEVYVLKNKLHFSQDGKHIFLVFLDEHRKMWQTVTLDALELRHVYELDYDLTPTDVNGQDVKLDPQMIKLKDDYLTSLSKGLGIDETFANRANGYVM
jgi:hypothetical protein